MIRWSMNVVPVGGPGPFKRLSGAQLPRGGRFFGQVKEAARADLIGTILASLRNHDGKGVRLTNEGGPARCAFGSLIRTLTI
jgi:hypothetical protein